MLRLIEIAYFGRLPRLPFFLGLVVVTGVVALLMFWIFFTAGGPALEVASERVSFSPELIQLPALLHENGVSELHIAVALMLTALYVILGTFMIAARARDCGLWGWAFAIVVYGVFFAAGLGDPWVTALAPLVLVFLMMWPSREPV